MVRTGTQDFWSDELFLPCTEEQVLSLLPEAVPAPHIAAFCYPHPNAPVFTQAGLPAFLPPLPPKSLGCRHVPPHPASAVPSSKKEFLPSRLPTGPELSGFGPFCVFELPGRAGPTTGSVL